MCAHWTNIPCCLYNDQTVLFEYKKQRCIYEASFSSRVASLRNFLPYLSLFVVNFVYSGTLFCFFVKSNIEGLNIRNVSRFYCYSSTTASRTPRPGGNKVSSRNEQQTEVSRCFLHEFVRVQETAEFAHAHLIFCRGVEREIAYFIIELIFRQTRQCYTVREHPV